MRLRPHSKNGTGRSYCAAAAACFLAYLCFPPGGPAQPAGAHSLVGRKAPEFARRDLSGHNLDLARFRHRVVLLNFWATWCAPCQAEMPVFASWQRQYGAQGFQVLGISMDDDPAAARRFVEKLGLDYPVAMGDAHLGLRYGGVLGLPMTFLIDREGVIRAQFQGESDPGAIEAEVKNLIRTH